VTGFAAAIDVGLSFTDSVVPGPKMNWAKELPAAYVASCVATS
jgi:hypothetical protein